MATDYKTLCYHIQALEDLDNNAAGTGHLHKVVDASTGKIGSSGITGLGLLKDGAKSGGHVSIAVHGITKYTASAAIVANAQLAVTTSGYIVTATSGSWVIGKNLNASVASGAVGTGVFDFIRPFQWESDSGHIADREYKFFTTQNNLATGDNKAIDASGGDYAATGYTADGILVSGVTSGQTGWLAVAGVFNGKAGSTLTDNQLVTVSASGWITAAGSGDMVIGVANSASAAGNSGSVIELTLGFGAKHEFGSDSGHIADREYEYFTTTEVLTTGGNKAIDASAGTYAATGYTANGLLASGKGNAATGELVVSGVFAGKAGGVIADGAMVTIAASGWIVTANSGDVVIGMANSASAAGNSGSSVELTLCFGGKQVLNTASGHIADREYLYFTTTEDVGSGAYKAFDASAGTYASNAQTANGLLASEKGNAATGELVVSGVFAGRAGGVLSDGDLVTIATSGWIVTAGSGDMVIGMANSASAAGNSGSTIELTLSFGAKQIMNTASGHIADREYSFFTTNNAAGIEANKAIDASGGDYAATGYTANGIAATAKGNAVAGELIVSGTYPVKAGDAILDGAMVTVTTSGWIVTAGSGDMVIGMANSASAAGNSGSNVDVTLAFGAKQVLNTMSGHIADREYLFFTTNNAAGIDANLAVDASGGDYAANAQSANGLMASTKANATPGELVVSGVFNGKAGGVLNDGDFVTIAASGWVIAAGSGDMVIGVANSASAAENSGSAIELSVSFGTKHILNTASGHIADREYLFFTTNNAAGIDANLAIDASGGDYATNGYTANGLMASTKANATPGELVVSGVFNGKAGGVLTDGQRVTVSASGWVTAAGSGDMIIGVANSASAAGNSGSAIELSVAFGSKHEFPSNSGWLADHFHQEFTTQNDLSACGGLGVDISGGDIAASSLLTDGMLVSGVASGTTGMVQFFGKTKLAKAGDVIALGESIKITTSGWFIKADSGDVIIGRALAVSAAENSGSAFNASLNFITPHYATSCLDVMY